MRRRTSIALIAVGALITAGALGAVIVNAAPDAHEYGGAGLAPNNIAALTSPATRLASVPPAIAGTLDGLGPDAGAVHTLGGGKAFAWVKPGRICWANARTAGCLAYEPEPLAKPIDWTVGDPDIVGGGAPVRVYGIATDEVRSVTAQLDDGRSVTVDAVGNFYDLELPEGVPPWSKLTLVAALTDGTSYSERI